MAHLLGIDLGSQGVKVACVDEAGGVAACSTERLEMRYPANGWAEQAPGDWLDRITAAVRSIPAALRGGVRAIATACQVDAVVPIADGGRPLHPAITWLDRRASDQAASLAAEVGADELFKRTGLVPDASHGLPKLLWLRRNRPDVWDEARWHASAGAFVNLWLTGALVHDRAHASSTMLYDPDGRLDEDLCALAELDPDLLPHVLPAASVVGSLAASTADVLGLPADCIVATGTGDEHAASLAYAGVHPGPIAVIAGTAEAVTTAADKLVLDEQRLVETHAHVVDGAYLVEHPGFVAGGSTQWLAERVLGVAQGDIFTLAGDAPPGCDGVVFVPALTGAVAPRWNSRVRGAFIGLSSNHGAPHLARAVLEGCAFALRDIVDRLTALGLGGDDVRIGGGGGRSHLWCEIRAEVLGCPVRPVPSPMPTAIGAAILAGVAAECFRDIDDGVAALVPQATETIEPDASRVEVYRERYAAYRVVFDQLEQASA